MKLTESTKQIFTFDDVKLQRSDTLCVGGRTLYYALLLLSREDKTEFAIAIGDGFESELRLISEDLPSDAVYEAIFMGGVTPCTLADVIDDMEAETTY